MSRAFFGAFLSIAFSLSACHAPPPAAIPEGRDPVATKTTVVAPPKYLDQQALARLEAFLPDAPPDHGAISSGEIELMIAMQSESTKNGQDRAKSEADLSVWSFANVLGPSFAKDKLPQTERLMKHVTYDAAYVSRLLKKRWERARPPLQDTRIVPIVGLPKSGSYPSGHSIHAMTCARILTLLAPSKEQDLLQMARLVAYDRVIAGVHFPTDVAAGLSLGRKIAEEIAASPQFQTDLANAKKEWASYTP